jgi:hypothetical protein
VDCIVISVMDSICGSLNGNCEVCCPLYCDAIQPGRTLQALRLQVPRNCW